MKNNKLNININSCKLVLICGLFLFSLFSFSCNDPVFYEISAQIKTPPPRVNGSPSNFIEIDELMYVASGNLIHIYNNETETWARHNQDHGRITSFAGTDTKIFYTTPKGLFYSESLDPLSFTETPLTIPDYKIINLFSAENEIFAGIMNHDGTSYFIYKFSGDSLEEITTTNYGLINGVAYADGIYYLSVKDQVSENGGGIYVYDGSSVKRIPEEYNIPFMGIISIDNTNVLAISRNGTLYSVNENSVNVLQNNDGTDFRMDKLSNGTLHVCYALNLETGKLDGSTRLLLVGRQDRLNYNVYSGFTYGYQEIELEGSNIKGDGRFRDPGEFFPSTLPQGGSHRDRYRTTLRTHPVKHLFMNKSGILFASTHKSGVWSLRDRNNNNLPYWNTEH